MTYDPIEDAMYEDMVDEWRDEAEKLEALVEEYRRGNLQDSFSRIGTDINKVTDLLYLSENLIRAGFNTQAVITSHTAVECTLRDLIIRPFFVGSVMDEDVAEMISETILNERVTKYENFIIFIIN